MVDHLRTFWVNVKAALETPVMKILCNFVVENLGARIADLTKQLETWALHFIVLHLAPITH